MKITRSLLLVAVVAALATSGCARDGDTSSTQPGAAPAGSASPELPTSSDLPQPSKGAEPGDTGAQTITGTVSAGVEPGCVVLTGGGKSHLLIFDDAALKSEAKEGATVVVTGRSDPGLMTTCQQGTPFLVTAVRPA
ncbi:hypothetical protein [Actinoplanes sp. NBRC 103695]|uniref:hypothetical protein n=1 Tax=Actinoplanes sp. NBRC 103695 TaxID=3032202 RepID=UPI0024A57F81|nr:hypothetical protein [Actinoplanes sp. NBRC 103695]GLZ00897.1 hypothetical protein Acsp02_81490 [Actinoplanes sp. NBRC 103695]